MTRCALFFIMLYCGLVTSLLAQESSFDSEIYQLKERVLEIPKDLPEETLPIVDVSLEDLHRPENRKAFRKSINRLFGKKRGFVTIVFQEDFMSKNTKPYSNRFSNADEVWLSRLNFHHPKSLSIVHQNYGMNNQVYLSDLQQQQIYRFVRESLHTAESQARVGPAEARKSYVIVCYLQYYPKQNGLTLLSLQVAYVNIGPDLGFTTYGELMFQIMDDKLSIYERP